MNIPREYNELVQLIENNDVGVAAQVILDTHELKEEYQE